MKSSDQCWRGRKAIIALIHCWQACKMITAILHNGLADKINAYLPYKPAKSFLAICPKEMKSCIQTKTRMECTQQLYSS